VKTSIYLPDELADRARVAGLNLSAMLRSAVLDVLESPDMPALAAVEGLIDGLDVVGDAASNALAEIARSLAMRLDLARHAHSAAMSIAVASIAKELRAVIDELAVDDEQGREFVASLFRDVEDSAEAF
jgi:hypothetical protein